MRGMTVKQDSIEALITSAKTGDRAAFDELLEAHSIPLPAWIRTRVGDRIRRRVEVEDVVQETQLRAFQSIERFTWRGKDSFHRWLCTIAQHLIWNASQKRSTDDVELAIDIPDSGVSPSRRLQRDERFDRLEQSIQRLSPDERQVIRLSRIEKLKLREIAVRMNRSELGVKSLLSRALRKLKESFGDTESLHLPDRGLSLGGSSHDDA